MKKQCEWCGKDFEVVDNVHGRRKRFCNTRCSAFWRNSHYGANIISEETKRKNAERMSNMWKDPTFRRNAIERMHTDNPVHKECVVQKIKETRLKRGSYGNNFKYGNGKISPHEQMVYDLLIENGFYYNYAINTKLARDAFTDRHYAKNYKPDFVNLKTKLCIEIDGENHTSKKQVILDKKKEECLRFLGFSIVRFTHKQVENGEVEKFIKYGKTCE